MLTYTVPGPVYADCEVVTLERMLSKGLWRLEEYKQIHQNARTRSELVQAGVAHAPQWFQEALQEIDPLLRARWDFETRMWSIDRWIPQMHWWQTLGYKHALGHAVLYELRKGDLWKRNARDYAREKSEQAARVRAENDRVGTDKVLGAIDGLSAKQQKEFIAVEEAVATGETITCHGQMEKTMDRMYEASKTAPDIPRGRSVNRALGKQRIKKITKKEIKRCSCTPRMTGIRRLP